MPWTEMTDLPKPDYARNMRLIGYTDQGGRPTACRSWCIAATPISGTCSRRASRVIDVRDPTQSEAPSTTSRRRPTPGTSISRSHDDLLLVIHAKDMFAGRRLRRRAQLLQGALGKTGRHAPRPNAGGAQLDGGHGGLRHLQAGGSRARSASCRSTAAASIASGTSAAAGPTRRRCSTASPTTSSSPST